MTKLEVYNECFSGISPKEITIAQIISKYKVYSKKYHPDNNAGKTQQEQEYAEKMFKEYIPILDEIKRLKENGTLEYELELERTNSENRNQYSYSSEGAYNQQQSNNNNQQQSNDSCYYRNDGNKVTIKPYGILKQYNLKKYEIRIENPSKKTVTTNFIYSDASFPLDNLEDLDFNMKSYIINECLSDERLENCIMSQGGYVGKYNSQQRTWEHNEEVGNFLNAREINEKMQDDGCRLQRKDGTWIVIHEIGKIEFNDANMYGDVRELKQYKYYDYSTKTSNIIKGNIDIEYLRQASLGVPIDMSYYSAFADEVLAIDRLKEKEQTLDGYVGTVGMKNNVFTKYNHATQILNYFQSIAREKANCRQAYYSNDDIKKAQEDVPEGKRRNVFGRMKDACRAFSEAFRD